MTDRRRSSAPTLISGMAAGMLLTLLVTAGLDIAASRGVTLPGALFASAKAGGAPAEPPAGVLRVPAGVATVLLDGRPATPAADGTVAAAPGPHRVHLENALGDAWVTGVTVAAGAATDVTPVWTGELILDGRDLPPGAGLRLDGAPCPLPPAVLDDVPAGEHVLTLHDGSASIWAASVTLRAGRARRVVVAPAAAAAADSAGPGMAALAPAAAAVAAH